ncbi:hypothetical protein HX109_11120 [Galbibacter sp. BG1]|uniref:hypothetical protein n=1 Tax=Galbibacter sp. BG1 TaxID=1170699 RepID=UPI0015B82401|nr:hypothetical protein [Galbibacter sp. BG1]QLE02079.1 hypothetical protein HX109_11120 [Galbibacter sp. BG1]
MKKTIIILLLSLLSVPLLAQKDSKRDHIKSLKIAFLTDQLALSPKEAEKFWPIYNAYDDEMFEQRYKEHKKIKHKLKDGGLDSMTEDEAKALLSEIELIDKNTYELNKKLNNDLEGVISAKKIILLKKLEDDFNRKLLDKLKKEYHRNRE